MWVVWMVAIVKAGPHNLLHIFFYCCYMIIITGIIIAVVIYALHCCLCLQVMLEQMQGLMHLELSGCNDFTEAGLWSSLNARLTSLSVSDCINVADDAIAAISQLLPNLSELSLQAYHVTDTAMAYFTAKQVQYTYYVIVLC